MLDLSNAPLIYEEHSHKFLKCLPVKAFESFPPFFSFFNTFRTYEIFPHSLDPVRYPLQFLTFDWSSHWSQCSLFQTLPVQFTYASGSQQAKMKKYIPNMSLP